MKNFYNEEIYKKYKQKLMISIIISSLLLLVFIGLFILGIILATRTNSNLIKIIFCVCLVLVAFVIIYILTLKISEFSKLLKHINKLNKLEKNEIIGTVIEINNFERTMSNNLKINRITILDENDEHVQINIVTKVVSEMPEMNKKYKFNLVNYFLIGFEEYEK